MKKCMGFAMGIEIMENVLCVAVSVSVSSPLGCTERDQVDKLIGRWQQVDAGEVGKLTAHIYKTEEGYRIGVVMPLANQPPVVESKSGKFMDSVPKVEDLEGIRLEPSTGRLLIGENEFEPMQ